MIGIKINGQYLDLSLNAATQVERNSPFSAGDEILGEYSLPLTIPATEKNIVLLGFITELTTLRTGDKVRRAATYEEHGMFMYTGTLVAEIVTIDLNNYDRSRISVYFLTAISSFYARAKAINLEQLDLGGVRTITNFQEHAIASWYGNSDTWDYTFMPVHNPKYIPSAPDPDESVVKMMNPIHINAGVVELNPRKGGGSVIPFPYYKFLLVRIFKQFGYTVGGTILDDPGFRKAFALAYNSIAWTEWAPFSNDPVVKPVVQFDLALQMPRDYPVSKFLINLGNLLGIGYNFDTVRNHCELISLNSLMEQGQRKDMTGKVQPGIKITPSKDAKVYALKLNFDQADARVGKPDLANRIFLGNFDTVDDLPAASFAVENNYALLRFVNQLWACAYDEDLQMYMWNYLADNIYDFEPAGNNNAIESDITPVGQSHVVWRESPAGTFHKALLPHVEQEGNWGGKYGAFVNWELRVLYNHGLQPDSSGTPVPFASSHNYTYTGLKVADYSLTYNAAEDSLVQARWARWLKVLQSMEAAEFVLNLARAEFQALSWGDVVLIRNIPFLLTGQTVASPYNDVVPCRASRIDFSPPPFVCKASIVPGSITVLDNGDGSVTVDFTPGIVPGTKWSYVLTNQDTGAVVASNTVSVHPFNITGLTGTANYALDILPQCGDMPGLGKQTKYFAIGVPAKVRLDAELRRNGNTFKWHYQATPIGTTIFDMSFSFRIGQCLEYDAVQSCTGFPTAPSHQEAYATMNGILGQNAAFVFSVASFQAGTILKKVVVHGLIGISPAMIVKADEPGNDWVLEFE